MSQGRGKREQEINLMAFVQDIRAGADDAVLMEKYGLTPKALKAAVNGLIKMGRITREEVDNRTLAPDAALRYQAKCPGCAIPLDKDATVCPRCGYLITGQSYLTPKEPTRRKPRKAAAAPAQSFTQDASDRSVDFGHIDTGPQTFDLEEDAEETPVHEAAEAEEAGPLPLGDAPDDENESSYSQYKGIVGGALAIVGFVVLTFLLANMDVIYFPDVPEKRLAIAAHSGDLSTVRKLLSAGVDVDSRSASIGFTPLMWASRAGAAETARYLIRQGANVNARSRLSATTALHLAAANGHYAVVRLLLAEGADPDPLTDDGISPLTLAHHANDRKMVKLLKDRGAVLD